jgi:hypothetical protein
LHQAQILTTVDFSEVRDLSEGSRVAKGNKVDAVMSKGREACNDSCLLATTGATGRDKHASGLAVQLALLPELAGGIPESLQKAGSSPMKTKGTKICTHLELGGHVTVASGDTENETVVVSEVAGF